MRLKEKTAPTVEPVSLDEAKLHLKVDSADDNALITALIKTARQLAEKETKRALITQTLQMYLDSAPAEIEIPRPPLQSVVSIKAISATESSVDETSAKDQAVLKIASTTGFAVDDTVVINRDGAGEEEVVILSIQDGISLTMTANLVYDHTAAQADRAEKYELVEIARYNVDLSENSPGRVKLRSGRAWPTHRDFASFIVEFKAGYGDAATDVPDALKQAILQLLSHLYENREAEEIPKGLKALFWAFKIMRI